VSFMDRAVAEQMDIDTEPLDVPLEAKGLNGTPLAWITHKTVPVSLLLSDNHQDTLSFVALDFSHCPLVLGFPWLQTHNPQLDWSTGHIISWSHFCHSHCLVSAAAPACPISPPSPEAIDLSSIR